MFNMSSQDTRRKVRLNEKVESRVRGDLYARFGGEYLETYHYKRWKGAGCLAYGFPSFILDMAPPVRVLISPSVRFFPNTILFRTFITYVFQIH